MLYTNLKHINTVDEYRRAIATHSNVVVACGRMDASSVNVYRNLESLTNSNKNVAFFDFEFDNPDSQALCSVVKVSGLNNLPYIAFFKQGSLCKVTSGVNTKKEIQEMINCEFLETIHV